MPDTNIKASAPQITNIPIAELKPAKYNPRKHIPGVIEKLKRSIGAFGCPEPLVVNKNMTVIGGHQRLKAVIELGWTEAPCVLVDLPKGKERALNIALNKISGEWDEGALALVLGSLEVEDLELTGFSEDELAATLKPTPDNNELLDDIHYQDEEKEKMVITFFPTDKAIVLKKLAELSDVKGFAWYA